MDFYNRVMVLSLHHNHQHLIYSDESFLMVCRKSYRLQSLTSATPFSGPLAKEKNKTLKRKSKIIRKVLQKEIFKTSYFQMNWSKKQLQAEIYARGGFTNRVPFSFTLKV